MMTILLRSSSGEDGDERRRLQITKKGLKSTQRSPKPAASSSILFCTQNSNWHSPEPAASSSIMFCTQNSNWQRHYISPVTADTA
ncbi:hypothetical protein MRB53_002462 [Persea americana]|uniref:Uncharacterized protein n=1 Tax=Persea americana TaxID=3435 RepID=A0ACC2MW76_PERAE|nr:hypothetical protein MRB53_002462 [Persea americana]